MRRPSEPAEQDHLLDPVTTPGHGAMDTSSAPQEVPSSGCGLAGPPASAGASLTGNLRWLAQLPNRILRGSSDDQRWNRTSGLLLYAASTVFVAFQTASGKTLGQHGVPLFEVVLARSVVILAFSLATLLREGTSPWGVRRGLLTVRGICGFMANVTLYWGVNLLPLSDAMVLTFMMPLVTASVAPWVLGEPFHREVLLAGPMCVVGVILIARPSAIFHTGPKAGSSSSTHTLGIMVGCAQPVFSAFAKMMVRLLRTTEKTNVIVFYMGFVSSLCAAFFCIVVPNMFRLPADFLEWGLLIGTGLAGYCAQLSLTEGLKRVDAAPATALSYLQVVWGELSGILIFHEAPSLLSLAGALLICSTMLLLAILEHKDRLGGGAWGAQVQRNISDMTHRVAEAGRRMTTPRFAAKRPTQLQDEEQEEHLQLIAVDAEREQPLQHAAQHS